MMVLFSLMIFYYDELFPISVSDYISFQSDNMQSFKNEFVFDCAFRSIIEIIDTICDKTFVN